MASQRRGGGGGYRQAMRFLNRHRQGNDSSGGGALPVLDSSNVYTLHLQGSCLYSYRAQLRTSHYAAFLLGSYKLNDKR